MSYNEKFKIRFSDVGVDQTIKKHEYLAIFQEAAGNFCYDNGISGPQLIKEDKTWIVRGYTVEFSEEQVYWRDIVNIETWPRSCKGIITPRDYIATREDGKVVARSTSTWALIDYNSKRPLKCDGLISSDWVNEKPALNSGAAGKILFPEDFDSAEKSIYKWEPGFSELDLNKHVNNVFYMSESINGATALVEDNKYLHEFRINYKQEVRNGNTILIKTLKVGDVYYQKMVRESDDVCVAWTQLTYKDLTNAN